ncbi:MAG: BREX system serine/threonine kinase PglW, partial [Pseudomonadales bacterium]|nr:BREX system serine/threonine kinase PglW [Pseudomonadales bacterium]
PGRPQLDDLVQSLDLGFQWDSTYTFANGSQGGYCLPIAGLTSLVSVTKTQYHLTQQLDVDTTTLAEVKTLDQQLQNVIRSARFMALTVRPRQWEQAIAKLRQRYPFKVISFDELLLRHVHSVCDSMPKPPDWMVVLKADASERNSKDWQNLQRLVQRALPAMTKEILEAGQPVLLTDPGLIARYDLVNTWLSDLRQTLMNASGSASEYFGLTVLIAADAQTNAAVIDGVIVPAGAGSKEFERIATSWLEYHEQELQGATS